MSDQRTTNGAILAAVTYIMRRRHAAEIANLAALGDNAAALSDSSAESEQIRSTGDEPFDKGRP
jgi:hypothetical protein